MSNHLCLISSLAMIVACGATAQSQSTNSAAYGARQALDDRVTVVEQQVVPGADAMPEKDYGYAPTGGAFTGVRTFAEQVKHLAAANWQLAARVLGEQPPSGTEAENAPPSVRSKAEIMEYLRGSFAILHRAITSVTDDNVAVPLDNGSGDPWHRQRLGLIIDAIAHSSDHYGQMVVYLRANGIVPPASR
jgi:uncharacterized damage-inducible protein DinB